MIDKHRILQLYETYFNGDTAEVDNSGLVSVEGNCVVGGYVETLPIQFAEVTGDFWCDRLLKSLKGSPRRVGGDFCCSNTKITSLRYSPKYVGGDFYCSDTKITSLRYSPKYVGGDFCCSNTYITNLIDAPMYISGEFWCNQCHRLTSLRGMPKTVVGDFCMSWQNYIVLLPILQSKLAGGIYLFSNHKVEIGGVVDIVRKYANNPNPKSVLLCAAELIEAGYEENARL